MHTSSASSPTNRHRPGSVRTVSLPRRTDCGRSTPSRNNTASSPTQMLSPNNNNVIKFTKF